MEKSNYGFGTRAIHAGNKRTPSMGALTTLYLPNFDLRVRQL